MSPWGDSKQNQNRKAIRGFDSAIILHVKYLHRGRNSVVECQLPKLKVAGSNPVARSKGLCFGGRGYALKFPRAVGFLRDDKKPEDANSVKEIIEMFEQQKKVYGKLKHSKRGEEYKWESKAVRIS